jgi:hypothetical protein
MITNLKENAEKFSEGAKIKSICILLKDVLSFIKSKVKLLLR